MRRPYLITISLLLVVAVSTLSFNAVAEEFSASIEHEQSTLDQFHFLAVAHGGSHPYAYDWDLGDGTKTKVRNPEHQYRLSQTWFWDEYTVTLNITDATGTNASAELHLTIINWPLTVLVLAVLLTFLAIAIWRYR